MRARQIPEWDSYDQEIARFAAKISAEEGVVAASVDDLAADKGVKAGLEVTESEEEQARVEGGMDDVAEDVAVEDDGHRIADEL